MKRRPCSCAASLARHSPSVRRPWSRSPRDGSRRDHRAAMPGSRSDRSSGPRCPRCRSRSAACRPATARPSRASCCGPCRSEDAGRYLAVHEGLDTLPEEIVGDLREEGEQWPRRARPSATFSAEPPIRPFSAMWETSAASLSANRSNRLSPQLRNMAVSPKRGDRFRPFLPRLAKNGRAGNAGGVVPQPGSTGCRSPVP